MEASKLLSFIVSEIMSPIGFYLYSWIHLALTQSFIIIIFIMIMMMMIIFLTWSLEDVLYFMVKEKIWVVLRRCINWNVFGCANFINVKPFSVLIDSIHPVTWSAVTFAIPVRLYHHPLLCCMLLMYKLEADYMYIGEAPMLQCLR